MSLKEATEGASVTVLKLWGSSRDELYFFARGIHPGAEIEILKKPEGGNVFVSAEGQKSLVNFNMTGKVVVI